MNLFEETVALKKIKLEGAQVRFVVDEVNPGFLFAKHRITELNVPVDKVNRSFLEFLRGRPNQEVNSNIKMELHANGEADELKSRYPGYDVRRR